MKSSKVSKGGMHQKRLGVTGLDSDGQRGQRSVLPRHTHTWAHFGGGHGRRVSPTFSDGGT